jgi:hypothetical protein
MQPTNTPDKVNEASLPAPVKTVVTEPDFSGDPQSIETFAVRDDFPQCALGAHVDIRGFAGVVVEIVNQSIKVSSPDGITQRFNTYRLKALCAPPQQIDPVPTTVHSDRPRPAAAAAPAQSQPKPVAPPRVHIADPDFTTPVESINDYAGRSDFPKCAYGRHVDVVGYAGVVVEIVKDSLKIQSQSGSIRSYNTQVLRKLYGKG